MYSDLIVEKFGHKGVSSPSRATRGAPSSRSHLGSIAKAIRFKDPEGNVVELIAGVDQVRDPYGARDVKPQGLNHVVFNTTGDSAGLLIQKIERDLHVFEGRQRVEEMEPLEDEADFFAAKTGLAGRRETRGAVHG